MVVTMGDRCICESLRDGFLVKLAISHARYAVCRNDNLAYHVYRGF